MPAEPMTRTEGILRECITRAQAGKRSIIVSGNPLCAGELLRECGRTLDRMGVQHVTSRHQLRVTMDVGFIEFVHKDRDPRETRGLGAEIFFGPGFTPSDLWRTEQSVARGR